MIVAGQTGVVFLIVALGFLGGRTGLFGDEASDGMANIAVSYVTPALIIMAFQREFEIELIRGFLVTAAGNLLIFAFCAAGSHLLIRCRDSGRRNVLRAATIFGNIGMMSLPLQQALFGSDGVFYCAASIAVFNMTFWSYCAVTMGEQGDRKRMLCRALCNAGTLGTIAGLVLFLLAVEIPPVPAAAMTQLANLNMPMCMLVIGQRLSKLPLRTLFNDRGLWGVAAMRMLFLPLMATAALWMLGVRGPVAVCLVISTAPPAAAAVNMLAITYKQDTRLAARAVSMQTLLAVFTMPVVIALACSCLL